MTLNNSNTNSIHTCGRDSFFANRTATALLSLFVLTYVALFCATSFMTYWSFGMSAYDIGIHDQALWKLSTLRGFFNTIRGMNIWGDHCWIIMAVMAPLYRIVPRLETLLAIQTIALAAGSFPLAAYAYRKIGSRFAALLLAVAFLLSPALQNMNLENAHPEVLAVPFILWMIAAAETDSWRSYSAALLLALFCKEDVALTTFAIGFFVFFRRNRLAGGATMLFSVVYFLFCMKVILPYANGSGFFRFQSGYWFSEFWNHKFDINYYFNILVRPQVGQYVWKLSMPLLGLFLLDPLLLLAAIPGFAINILSGNDYLIGIDYHYNYHTLPILCAAAAGGIARARGWLRLGHSSAVSLALLVCAASVAANIAWSQAPLTKWHARLSHQWRNYQESQEWQRFGSLTSVLPENRDIPVAASHNLVPALTHRTEIFMFPNPWQVHYWGIAGEKTLTPDRVEWLVLDSRVVDKGQQQLVTRLFESREFCAVTEDGPWLVARRNAPAGTAAGSAPVCPPRISVNGVPAVAPAQGIKGSVYIYKEELKSLRSLNGVTPDFEISTDTMSIPETQGVLALADGQNLKASDNVRVVFAGRWRAQGKGATQFRVHADDGCRIYVDGEIVLDYNGPHAFGAEAASKPLHLSKGEHVIVVDYFEWGGNAGLNIEWQGVNGKFEELKAGALLP
ncbi:MAG: DUF2079 domain-containing protein [Desulfuromonadaceae bacterium]|nr:DUF2079 domain-containing protein [Desulfuromonadaceae bacterium]MDD5106489.1 DUF2079 domain-containing protein [Desulfuromonadaceae bacterium]